MTRIWTDSHRRFLINLIVALAIWLTWQLLRHPAEVSDPQPAAGSRAAQLKDKLDPNTAPWEELAILPGMGEKKAKAIIAYRQEFTAAHPNEPAFSKLADLTAVKGIATSTLNTIEPYLSFPIPISTSK